MKRAIIIMAKVPIAGTVKTRLQTVLSPDECAALAAAFLQDAFAKSQTVCADTMIAVSPFCEADKLKNILHAAPLLIEQTGADLGARMCSAFEFAFENDSDAVVMIGTDSPTFPARYIEQGFELLKNADAVLGAASDGGFYLIGLRRLKRQIFENVEWSSPRTFEQTKRNFMNSDFDLREIAAWYDVDRPEDLRRLYDEFQADERTRQTAPKTFQWLTNRKIFPKPNE